MIAVARGVQSASATVEINSASLKRTGCGCERLGSHLCLRFHSSSTYYNSTTSICQ